MAGVDKFAIEVAGYFKEKREVIRKRWVQAMQSKGLLAGLTAEELETESSNIYDTCVECLETGKFDSAQTYAKAMAERGVFAGMTSEQIVSSMLTLRDVYGRAIFENYGKDPEKWMKILDTYEPVVNNILGIVSDAFVKEREKLIKQQQEALLELSTPVIRIWEKVLSVPLIGTLDSPRTQLVMETLLQRIVDTQSRVVILDISGIPGIDTLVANHLIRTVTATRLLGAECIVTGISSKIAQTLVHLGVDLSGIITRSSMSDGIAMAFEILSLKVVPK
jgi:rsbT co-antagonist protein RsbR